MTSEASKTRRGGRSAAAIDFDTPVTPTQLGSFLGVTVTWVQKLVKDGAVTKNKDGYIALSSGVRGYIGWLKAQDRRSSKTASASRLQEAKARKAEIDTALAEGRAIDLELAESIVFELFGEFRSHLSGLASDCTRDTELRQTIEDKLNGRIERLRTAIEAKITSLQDGIEDSLAGEEADG